jgi:hypothetical protein
MSDAKVSGNMSSLKDMGRRFIAAWKASEVSEPVAGRATMPQKDDRKSNPNERD